MLKDARRSPKMFETQGHVRRRRSILLSELAGLMDEYASSSVWSIIIKLKFRKLQNKVQDVSRTGCAFGNCRNGTDRESLRCRNWEFREMQRKYHSAARMIALQC
jgi:hypothetical protein